MKYSIFAISIVMSLLTFSCAPDEDPLEPSGNYSVLRFEFPQGNNSWDAELKEIHDNYGVYLLYKEITEKDLNKSWTAVPTGNLYYGEALNDQQVQYYVDFFKNNFFAYISPEFAKNSMPIKIYMLDNLRAVPQGSQDETAEDGYSSYFINTRFDGFDYWAVSFKQNEIDDPEATDLDGLTSMLKIKRCAFIYKLLVNALQNGDLEEPVEFGEETDYQTSYTVEPAAYGTNNYYLNRGFINALTTDFQYNRNGLRETTSTYVSYWKSTQTIEPAVGAHRDFMVYVRAAMFYTRRQFYRKYNQADFPLISKKYECVIDYFKNTVGIDLEGIAKAE